jgi:acetylornithine deacetylase/succinyl-diaminopimelate desuccinylase-like protein
MFRLGFISKAAGGTPGKVQERPHLRVQQTILTAPPTLNFGPGDPSQAHQPNEHVLIDDLVTCTKVVALTAARWCR